MIAFVDRWLPVPIPVVSTRPIWQRCNFIHSLFFFFFFFFLLLLFVLFFFSNQSLDGALRAAIVLSIWIIELDLLHFTECWPASAASAASGSMRLINTVELVAAVAIFLVYQSQWVQFMRLLLLVILIYCNFFCLLAFACLRLINTTTFDPLKWPLNNPVVLS